MVATVATVATESMVVMVVMRRSRSKFRFSIFAVAFLTGTWWPREWPWSWWELHRGGCHEKQYVWIRFLNRTMAMEATVAVAMVDMRMEMDIPHMGKDMAMGVLLAWFSAWKVLGISRDFEVSGRFVWVFSFFFPGKAASRHDGRVNSFSIVREAIDSACLLLRHSSGVAKTPWHPDFVSGSDTTQRFDNPPSFPKMQ